MNWLSINKMGARPIIAIEDHAYHISELLQNINDCNPDLISSLTVVCLDRPGPDTRDAVIEWLNSYDRLQIAFRAEADECSEFPENHRWKRLSNKVFENQNEFCLQVSELIRPAGLIVQDINLETLEFVPRDRWWESTLLASTVRGIVGQPAPKCAFMSNKRGYEATFGAELLAAGHDPRDVLNKLDMKDVVVPFLQSYLDEQFPWLITWLPPQRKSFGTLQHRVARSQLEMNSVDSFLDLVIWPNLDQQIQIGGRIFKHSKTTRFSLQADGNEAQSWIELVQSKLADSTGVEVQTVGQRIAPAGALRAETTNAAARHIHSLRKRLLDAQDIVTIDGHYRLRDGLSVGLVQFAS